MRAIEIGKTIYYISWRDNACNKRGSKQQRWICTEETVFKKEKYCHKNAPNKEELHRKDAQALNVLSRYKILVIH